MKRYDHRWTMGSIAFLFFTQYRVFFNAMMMGDGPWGFHVFTGISMWLVVAVLIASLGINLWDYRFCRSYYPHLQKFGGYKLQKAFLRQQPCAWRLLLFKADELLLFLIQNAEIGRLVFSRP